MAAVGKVYSADPNTWRLMSAELWNTDFFNAVKINQNGSVAYLARPNALTANFQLFELPPGAYENGRRDIHPTNLPNLGAARLLDYSKSGQVLLAAYNSANYSWDPYLVYNRTAIPLSGILSQAGLDPSAYLIASDPCFDEAGHIHVLVRDASATYPSTGELVTRQVTLSMEQDSDADGLPDDWEMFYLGTLEQDGTWDADIDGLTNLTEFIAYSNASQRDTDEDGFLDGEDTDPKDPEKHPPPVTYLVVARKAIQIWDYSPSFWQQLTTNFLPPEWATEISLPSTPYIMENTLNAIEFPTDALDPRLAGAIGDPSAGASATGSITRSLSWDGEYYTGSLESVRVWLVHKPKETFAVEVNYLRTKANAGLGITNPSPEDPQLHTLTVHAGSTQSSYIDLEPTLTDIVSYYETSSSTVALLPVEVNVDLNNDKVIESGEMSNEGHPFDIWINDDDDKHAPQAKQRADYTTASVDGEDDVADLFPVFIDAQQVVAAFPPGSGVSYKLKQADGALNFVETSLTREQAFSYRDNPVGTGCSSATTQQITSGGTALSTAFLNCIKDNNGGVILVEGRKPSKEPLVLVVENSSMVAEIKLPLSIHARILLLLHGMNSNTATWDGFVGQYFGNATTNGAGAIREGQIQSPGTAPLMTSDGVRCYRLQFGAYDPSSTRAGLEGVTAASTSGYLTSVDTRRCGDFETFAQLGQEVDEAIDALLDPSDYPENENAQIILVGHSRGGLSARAFLQSSSSNREAVIGLVTTGTPHMGSRMGRIYNWLDTHRRGAAGTDEDDWELVDDLRADLAEGMDMRRPVIQDLADGSPAITSLNAGAGSLPVDIRYGQIAYSHSHLGFLWRGWKSGVWVDYDVFDLPGPDLGEQLSDAAAVNILDPGHTATDYPGDGLIPVAGQQFRSLVSSFGMFVIFTVSGATVLHIEEPRQHDNIGSTLRYLAPTWFPALTP